MSEKEIVERRASVASIREYHKRGSITSIEAYPAQIRNSITVSSSTRSRPWWKLGGQDFSHVSVDEGQTFDEIDEIEEHIQTKRRSVFQAPEAVELYKPIEGYEGSHRFDPNIRWTDEEEKALVRSLDWRIALPACLMFFALQLDRGNIVQALSDNMLKDLGLTTQDYNNGQTIFYCSFLTAELPSQLISKKLGPDVWIPIQMICWSIVGASQAALTGRTTFYITRFLMGLIEGGFIPDVILYLSYFFKNSELPKRLSWFWTSYQSTQVVGAVLAYGILHLRGHGSLKEGWRYLFVIEGCFTGLIGIITYLYLPASPTQTARTGIKGCLRPKQGWFTQREETIMVTRILRDDPGKATMHNRQGLSFRHFKKAITDYDLWPMYLLGLGWLIPSTPPQAYLTLTTKALGFTTFETNLLTIPAYVIFILQLLFWTWVSEKINQRLVIGVIGQLWMLPLLISLVALPKVFHNSNWIKWLLSTLIVGSPYCHAVLVALTSRNSGSVETRTVGSSLYNMTVQMANIFASQVYRPADAPYYYTGNKALLGVLAWNVTAFVLAKFYYVYKNNKRDRIWNAMTREQRIEYLTTTTDVGNKRLDFRFAS